MPTEYPSIKHQANQASPVLPEEAPGGGGGSALHNKNKNKKLNLSLAKRTTHSSWINSVREFNQLVGAFSPVNHKASTN